MPFFVSLCTGLSGLPWFHICVIGHRAIRSFIGGIGHRAIGPAMGPSLAVLEQVYRAAMGPSLAVLGQGYWACHGSLICSIGHRAIGPAMGPSLAVLG